MRVARLRFAIDTLSPQPFLDVRDPEVVGRQLRRAETIRLVLVRANALSSQHVSLATPAVKSADSGIVEDRKSLDTSVFRGAVQSLIRLSHTRAERKSAV